MRSVTCSLSGSRPVWHDRADTTGCRRSSESDGSAGSRGLPTGTSPPASHPARLAVAPPPTVPARVGCRRGDAHRAITLATSRRRASHPRAGQYRRNRIARSMPRRSTARRGRWCRCPRGCAGRQRLADGASGAPGLRGLGSGVRAPSSPRSGPGARQQRRLREGQHAEQSAGALPPSRTAGRPGGVPGTTARRRGRRGPASILVGVQNRLATTVVAGVAAVGTDDDEGLPGPGVSRYVGRSTDANLGTRSSARSRVQPASAR